jgi:RNA polymerase sigma-70 factor (ECF subfamily)
MKTNLSTAPRADAPDAELAGRVALGDTAAFETLMRRHNRMLFRTARAILRDDAEAEDALQEAYLHAYEALMRLRKQTRRAAIVPLQPGAALDPLVDPDMNTTPAEVLRIPPATVRSRLFRARSLLREALAAKVDLACEEAFGFAGERCDRIVANVLARLR